MTFFNLNNVYVISDASIQWETVEQYFFWQFVSAEDISPDWITQLIPKLEYPSGSIFIIIDFFQYFRFINNSLTL